MTGGTDTSDSDTVLILIWHVLRVGKMGGHLNASSAMVEITALYNTFHTASSGSMQVQQP